jgi:hypothetical protein
LADASYFVFAAKTVSLDLLNAELFKPTTEGYDGQEDDKSLKVSSCFGGPFVNACNCWSVFVCAEMRVNCGGETTFEFLIQILIFLSLCVHSHFLTLSHNFNNLLFSFFMSVRPFAWNNLAPT